MRPSGYLNCILLLGVSATGLLATPAWSQVQPTTLPAPSAATPEPSAAAPSEPVQNAEACVPACRASFICTKGQCVSICNPPCGAGEVCTANAQCVAATAQPAPAYPAAGANQQQDSGRMTLATEPDDEKPNKPEGAQIKSFSFAARLGAQLGGSGTSTSDCTGSICGTGSSDSSDYDVNSALALSLDFLFKVGKIVRLGPGFMYTHTMDAKFSGDTSSHELGNMTDLDFVLEFVPRVSPSVWLVPRFQLGLMAFNATGSGSTAEQNEKTACLSGSSGVSFSGCDSIDSPHIGFNAGLGFGVLFATGSSVRLRIDTLLDYYSFGVEDVTANTSSGSGQLTVSASGTRYFLLAGLEI